MKRSMIGNLAILAGVGFAYQKLGLPEVTVSPEYPPKSEVGHMSQAEWQAEYGGSYLDYRDWLLGV